MLEKEDCQNTILSVINLAGREGTKENIKKEIQVKLKSIKMYRWIQVGVLSIS
jgi:hypothetical protein